MRTEQLTIERMSNVPLGAGAAAAATTLKTILLHVQNDPSLDSRLEAAFAGASLVDAPHMRSCDADRGLRHVWQRWRHFRDERHHQGARGRRCKTAIADLLVAGRAPKKDEFAAPAIGILGDLLSRCRTPIFIFSEQESAFDPTGEALIAWDGSYEGGERRALVTWSSQTRAPRRAACGWNSDG